MFLQQLRGSLDLCVDFRHTKMARRCHGRTPRGLGRHSGSVPHPRPMLGHMPIAWPHHNSTTEGLREVGLLAKLLPLENSWGCWKPVKIRCPFILLYPSGMAHRLTPKETHHPL